MAFTRAGIPNHDVLPGVSTADHHIATVAGDLDLADLNARAHADLSDSPANAHHNLAHNLDSHPTRAHSDVTGIGASDHHGAASIALMESESSNDVWVRPDRLKRSPGVCKVWGGVVAAGTLTALNYNVSSVTDTGTGDRTVVFDDDFSTNVFSLVSDVNAQHHPSVSSAAVGSVQIEIFDHVPAAADASHEWAIFGDQ